MERRHPFDAIPFLESGRIVLKRLDQSDYEDLYRLAHSSQVYRFLPTFLYEQKYDDIHRVIDGLYTECIEKKESIILGIFLKDGMVFCGLAEMYGYKESIHKISIGYRLLEEFWGHGIASEAVGLLVDHLYSATDVEIITASTMIENKASERVLQKNGFIMTAAKVGEDWGYPEDTIADKWFR